MARRDFEKSGGGSEKVGRANQKDEHTMNEAARVRRAALVASDVKMDLNQRTRVRISNILL